MNKLTKLTLQEAQAVLSTRLNSENFLALDDKAQQAYLDISYLYLESLDLDYNLYPTDKCLNEQQAVMALWDFNMGLSELPEEVITEAKVGPIAVKYADKAKVSRIPLETALCLKKYNYPRACSGLRQCKVERS